MEAAAVEGKRTGGCRTEGSRHHRREQEIGRPPSRGKPPPPWKAEEWEAAGDGEQETRVVAKQVEATGDGGKCYRPTDQPTNRGGLVYNSPTIFFHQPPLLTRVW